jgi:hypothetical protein
MAKKRRKGSKVANFHIRLRQITNGMGQAGPKSPVFIVQGTRIIKLTPAQYQKRLEDQRWLEDLDQSYPSQSCDDLDWLLSTNLGAQLAAVPSGCLHLVSPEAAMLVRAAKQLHQEPESGAAERDARGELYPDIGKYSRKPKARFIQK